MDRATKLAKEQAAEYLKQSQEIAEKWRSKPSAEASAEAPVNDLEYVPPTTQELYAAKQTNSPAWKRHLDELAKLY
ncbi:hypothetical protein DSM106972_056580 [Dulcicalothrix desertica PCC 7102]|uniref:Uncharacterized protein n=2 Tax=Dulcicalothrix desertica TaxID=32056 RepID=A0A3S1CHD9_9CYAN|nr:hypothetical protein DSM106972_056580 [Dulcicalothrix desertica PCC 7102]